MNYKVVLIFMLCMLANVRSQNSDTTIILPGGAIDQMIWHNRSCWDAAKTIYVRIDQRHSEKGNFNGNTSHIRYYFNELKTRFKKRLPEVDVLFNTDSLDFYPDIIIEVNFINFKKGTEDDVYNIWTGTRYATVHVKMNAYIQNSDRKVFDLEHASVNVLTSKVLRHDPKSGLLKLLISRNAGDVADYLADRKPREYSVNLFPKIPIERKEMVSVVFYNGETAKGYYLGEDDRYLYYKENDNSRKVSLLKSVITNYEIIKN